MVGGGVDRNNCVELGRCKPFLMVPSCGCRVSNATERGKLQVQLCP
jgi:hypothetical protein